MFPTRHPGLRVGASLLRGLFVPLFLTGLVVTCGGDDGPTEPEPDPNTVGADGGTVSLQEGQVQVSVPSGAVSSDVTITAEPASNPPASDELVGGSAVELGPDGQQFDQPVTVTLAYDASAVPDGVPEGELRLATVSDGAWELVDGSQADPSGDRVSGQVDHFSVFGVLALTVDAVSVTAGQTELEVGGTTTLSVTATAADGTELDRPTSFSSSDESVATVDDDGTVTATGKGETTITATVDGVSGQVTINVVAPVASIEVNPTEADMVVGETLQLEVTVKGPDGETLDRSVSHSSSDESVASVSGSGEVTANAVGEATITVESGGVSVTVTIRVTDPVASITVEPSEVTLDVGATQELSVTVVGESGNTLDVNVTFSSSAEGVATVDSDGIVTAVAPGVATITVEADGVTATVTVSVPIDYSPLAGTWTGQWNNTTFGSTGSAEFVIEIDEEAGTFKATVDLGGNVFGASDPPAQEFTGELGDTEVNLSGSNAVYGDYSITGDADGSFEGTLTNVPASGIDSVEFSGTVSDGTISMTYTINFSGGGTAEGTLEVTKQ